MPVSPRHRSVLACVADRCSAAVARDPRRRTAARRAVRARPPRRRAPTPSRQPTRSPRSPLTIDNCGTEVTFEAAPERVVTIKSSTLELLLALGLEDRIVGTAFSDGPVPDELRRRGIRARGALRQGALAGGHPRGRARPGLRRLGVEPLGRGRRRPRHAREQLGVATYVAPAACKGEGYMPDPLTFDEVFREFEEAGADLRRPGCRGRPGRRAARRARRRSSRTTTGSPRSGTRSGDDTPYVGAGIGAPQMIMDAAGLENVAADVHDTWTSMGWEAIVAADPDVIVLVDAAVEHRRVRRSRSSRRTPRPRRCPPCRSSATSWSTSRRPRRACGTSARWRRSSTSSESSGY